ncbi:hypothetical protein L9F63_018568 [Diploptera punctata]|uniref:RNA-binding region-containing protein 3 n=1 Tax=Diploptera punctata TaxID=6984 RepID=A0AAD7ZW74_DIPPU|nr:hypothetical protein L9F63_018568 [Diploptera punctata]
MSVLSHRISIEFARGTTDKILSPAQKHDIHHKKEEEEESKGSCKKHFQAFQHKLNNWNSSLNITQSAPSHLKYQYPPPTQIILRNICCALASVPKFYTHILYLMSKMNLPCQFDSPPFPETDIMDTPQVSEQSQNVLIPKASSDQDEDEERELESGGEGKIIPPKRSLPQKPKKVKRLILIKPVPSSSVIVKPIKPEQIFEKSGTILKNYQPGIPSCRLYIKNLSKQVTERDLHYIYRRYLFSEDEMGGSMFNVQLIKEGRMKGQAFITLQNVKQAEAALKETNGYILKDKPLVVQFASSEKAKLTIFTSNMCLLLFFICRIFILSYFPNHSSDVHPLSIYLLAGLPLALLPSIGLIFFIAFSMSVIFHPFLVIFSIFPSI